MADLIALIESVPLPVYALLGAVGLLLILWALWQPRERQNP